VSCLTSDGLSLLVLCDSCFMCHFFILIGPKIQRSKDVSHIGGVSCSYWLCHFLFLIGCVSLLVVYYSFRRPTPYLLPPTPPSPNLGSNPCGLCFSHPLYILIICPLCPCRPCFFFFFSSGVFLTSQDTCVGEVFDAVWTIHNNTDRYAVFCHFGSFFVFVPVVFVRAFCHFD
jgi:hypothetical protein